MNINTPISHIKESRLKEFMTFSKSSLMKVHCLSMKEPQKFVENRIEKFILGQNIARPVHGFTYTYFLELIEDFSYVKAF